MGLKRRGVWRPGVVVVATELEVDFEQQVGEVLHPEPVALEQLVRLGRISARLGLGLGLGFGLG